MIVLQRLICLVIIAASAAVAATTPVRAAAQRPALLTTLVGTWNCTYQSPKGKQTSSITFTRLNDLWIQGISQNGAYAGHPANQGFTMIGYDAKKKQYVAMGASTMQGDYGVGTASASPSSMTMVFTGAYPADPTHDKTTYHFTANGMTNVDNWTEKGKPMTGHGTCTKR